MWQGTQKAFLDDNGNVCAGVTVAIAIGDQAACYAAQGGELRCAGNIGANVFGPNFTAIPGAGAVDQILISSTFNAPDHNSVCVRRTDGTGACMGKANDHGQFGTGSGAGSPSFVGWGNVGGIVALGTGTWDQMCALTSGGDLYCAGYNFGLTPSLVAFSVQAFYCDTFGMIVADPMGIFRAANVRTDCLVEGSGLVCNGPPPNLPTFGSAGHVVDGTYTLNYAAPNQPPGKSRYCWLDDQGKATCVIIDMFMPGSPQVTPVFTAHRVLALAGNPYSSSLCAVYDDGSIACRGDNAKGQLGTNASVWLNADTVVAPPGSVDLACQ